MKSVGIRELKNKLSEYIRCVEAGESVLVTDRGTVVAEIRPPGASTGPPVDPAIAGLLQRGLLVAVGSNESHAYPSLPRALKRLNAKRLLDEERGGR